MSAEKNDPHAMDKEQQKRLKTLIAAGQTLARIEDLEELLPRLLDLAQNVTDAEASSILLYNPERNVLEFALAMNEILGQTNTDILKRKVELPLGKGIAGWVGRERKSLNVPDAQSDERFDKEADKRTGFTTRSILCVPIIRGEDLLGVVQVLNAKKKNFFDKQDQELLESFAGMVAVALDWAKLRIAMREQMSRRPLAQDCWKHIGYAGDQSCPKLERYTHCRNCPVFVEAGHELFNREPPEEYTRHWTESLAQVKESERAGTVSVVIFRLGEEWLALGTEHFLGVFENRTVRPVPHKTRPVLSGLAVAHGEILPCISLSHLMGIQRDAGGAAGRGVYKRLLCAGKHGNAYVFQADEVRDVYRVPVGRIEELPDTLRKSKANHSKGIFPYKDKRKKRNEKGEWAEVAKVYQVTLLDSERIFNAFEGSLK